jgi:hypothetical protein
MVIIWILLAIPILVIAFFIVVLLVMFYKGMKKHGCKL